MLTEIVESLPPKPKMPDRRWPSVHDQNAVRRLTKLSRSSLRGQVCIKVLYQALIAAHKANPEHYNTWLIATCTALFLLGLDIVLQFIFFLGEFHMTSEDVIIRAIQSGSIASTFFITFYVPGVKSLLELWEVVRWVNLVFNLGFLAESNLGISSGLGRSDA